MRFWQVDIPGLARGVPSGLLGGILPAVCRIPLRWSITAQDAPARPAQVELARTNFERANVSVPLVVTVAPLVTDLLAEPGSLVQGCCTGGRHW